MSTGSTPLSASGGTVDSTCVAWRRLSSALPLHGGRGGGGAAAGRTVGTSSARAGCAACCIAGCTLLHVRPVRAVSAQQAQTLHPCWLALAPCNGMRWCPGRQAGRRRLGRTSGSPTLPGQSGRCGCRAVPAARTSPGCGTSPPPPTPAAGRNGRLLQAGGQNPRLTIHMPPHEPQLSWPTPTEAAAGIHRAG